MNVAMITGTYNRLAMLQRAVASIRETVGKYEHKIIVIDGGSTDGSLEWLEAQDDIHTIRQTELTGAVRAFNLGFGYAVDKKFDFIGHLNDDAELISPLAIEHAIDRMIQHPLIGEVAFELDLWGDWRFDNVNGRIYANFGVVRRSAGEAVARQQGDPTGRNWWNPIYRHYGADSEFGVWLWKLGWRVDQGIGIRVHDLNAKDALRQHNDEINNRNPDGELFWSRWRNENWGGCLAPLVIPSPYPQSVVEMVPAPAPTPCLPCFPITTGEARDPLCVEQARHRSNCDCIDRSPINTMIS